MRRAATRIARHLLLLPAALLLLFLLSGPALAAAGAAVTLPACRQTAGGASSADGIFTFELTALQDAPMPAGSTDGTARISVRGSEAASFGEIVYAAPGTYTYEVREAAGADPDEQYDAAVYRVTVQVTWRTEVNGALQASVTLNRDGSGEKQERILFENRYTGPAAPAGQTDAGTPKTGDEGRRDLWWALLALSAAAFAVTLRQRRRKNRPGRPPKADPDRR